MRDAAKLVEGLQRDHGLQLHQLASFVYFNPSAVRLRTLHVSRIPRDTLETVVLSRTGPSCRFRHDSGVVANHSEVARHYSGKILPGLSRPFGIEGLLDALHHRDRLGRHLERQVLRLREADAVLAGDRSLERDDALEQRLLGRADAGVASSGSLASTMMLTWMLPSPTWPKRGNQQRLTRARSRSTSWNSSGMRPFGTTMSWLNFSAPTVRSGVGQLAPRRATPPGARPRRARAGPRSRRLARHASSTSAISVRDRGVDAVHLDHQQRLGAGRGQRLAAEIRAQRVEADAIDELERRRHDAARTRRSTASTAAAIVRERRAQRRLRRRQRHQAQRDLA